MGPLHRATIGAVAIWLSLPSFQNIRLVPVLLICQITQWNKVEQSIYVNISRKPCTNLVS